MSHRRSEIRRALLIAYYFPPIAATGGMRPLNFCRHLASSGWAPQVLAADHESALPPYAVDDKLLDRIPPDVEVIRVPQPNPRGRLLWFRERLSHVLTQRKISSPTMGTGSPVRSQGSAKGPTSPVRACLRFMTEALLEFPDPQCHWYRPAVRALTKNPSRERPHIIWATGGPWTSLLVGRRLAQEFNVPFIADFRDPWIGGYELFSSEILRRRTKWLERDVCAAAARVVLNTDELRAEFSSRYPEFASKFVTITNGYSTDLVAEGLTDNIAKTGNSLDGDDAIVIELSHFGTVYSNRNPAHLFRAVRQIIEEGRIDASRLRLRFFGGWEVNDQRCNQLAKELEESGVLKRVPPIPHRECVKEMARADVLLILQPDFPLQVPAKIFEYIVAGRPLLVIGGEGATANLVRHNRLGVSCSNETEEIKRQLLALLSDRTQLVTPDPRDTAKFDYRLLSGRLAELFETAVGEHHSR